MPKKGLPTGEKGMAMVFTLLAVAVLVLLMGAAAGMGSNALKAGSFWRDRTIAFDAAESGVSHALYLLNQGQSPLSLSSPKDLLAGGASYEASLAYPRPRQVQVEARGSLRSFERQVRARIHLSGLPAGLFQDTEPAPPDGIIGNACNSGQYSSVTFPSDGEMTPPVDAGPGGNLDLSGARQSIGPGTYSYRQVTLKSGARLEVKGPATLYLAGKLEVEDATLRLGAGVILRVKGDVKFDGSARWETGGPATLFARGNATFKDKAVVKNQGPLDIFVRGKTLEIQDNAALGRGSPDLVIYLTTDTTHEKVKLQDRAVIRGGLYAPATSYDVAGRPQVTGALVGCPVCGGGGKGGKGEGGGGGNCPAVTYDLGALAAQPEPGGWGE